MLGEKWPLGTFFSFPPHLAAARASAARLKEEASANPTAFSLPPSLTNLVGPLPYFSPGARSLSSRPSTTRIDTRATRADYCCPGLTSCLLALPACLLACLLPSSPTPTPTLHPASQPNPLTASASLFSSPSRHHPRTHVRTSPTSHAFCPVRARASVAQRERASTARPPAARSAGSCLALKYRQPRLCSTGQSAAALPCLVLPAYSNNTVTPACPCACQSIERLSLA